MAAAPDVDFEDGVAQNKGKGLILGIAAVLVLGGGGAAFFLLSSDDGSVEKPKAAPAKPNEVGPIVPLDTFVVNLNTSRSNRYLKVTLAIELSAEGLEEEVTKRKPMIRDRVITYLTGLSVEEVRGGDTKEAIRAKLLGQVNKAFGSDGIVSQVLFTEFVVQ